MENPNCLSFICCSCSALNKIYLLPSPQSENSFTIPDQFKQSWSPWLQNGPKSETKGQLRFAPYSTVPELEKIAAGTAEDDVKNVKKADYNCAISGCDLATYNIVDFLGEGSFGKVHLVELRCCGKRYAQKKIPKAKGLKKSVRNL